MKQLIKLPASAREPGDRVSEDLKMVGAGDYAGSTRSDLTTCHIPPQSSDFYPFQSSMACSKAKNFRQRNRRFAAVSLLGKAVNLGQQISQPTQ